MAEPFFQVGVATLVANAEKNTTTRDHQLYVSKDFGVTWTASGSRRYGRDVALSADGSKLVASDSGGYICTTGAQVAGGPRLVPRVLIHETSLCQPTVSQHTQPEHSSSNFRLITERRTCRMTL